MVMMMIIIINNNHQSSIINHQSPITNHQSSIINHPLSIMNHQHLECLSKYADIQFSNANLGITILPSFPVAIKRFNAKEHQETVGCSHHGGISSRDVLRRDQKAMVKNGCSINLVSGVAIFSC